MSRAGSPTSTQFGNIIVKTGSDGAITRLTRRRPRRTRRADLRQAFTLDGKPAAGIAIFQSPDANALDVEARVKAQA